MLKLESDCSSTVLTYLCRKHFRMVDIKPPGAEGSVRIVRITRGGANTGWSAFGQVLSKLSPNGFVAVDTEFSGLGNDPRLSDNDLSVRYDALRDVVSSHAILSVGLAMFNPCDDSSTYDVAAFDFIMCCEEPWTISPDAAKFLVGHGFDFNRLFSSGISYVSASSSNNRVGKRNRSKADKVVAQDAPFVWGPIPQGLLWRIGRRGVPIIVHNGLQDVAFLFAAFHAKLPSTLSGFVSALLDMAPAGFYDTKHLALTAAPERVTYLSYLYAKHVQKGLVSVRTNANLPSDEVTSPDVHKTRAERLTPAGPTSFPTVTDSVAVNAHRAELCALFLVRGYCPREYLCSYSHDPFKVLEYESQQEVPRQPVAWKLYAVQQRAAKASHRAAMQEIGEVKKKLSKKQRKKQAQKTSEPASNVATSDAPLGITQQHHLEGTECAVPVQGVQSDMLNGSDVDAAQHVPQATQANAISSSRSSVHCAGYDAYMTGYCFASIRHSLKREALHQEHNKLFLSKKRQSLLLCKSDFEELNTVKSPAQGSNDDLPGEKAEQKLEDAE